MVGEVSGDDYEEEEMEGAGSSQTVQPTAVAAAASAPAAHAPHRPPPTVTRGPSLNARYGRRSCFRARRPRYTIHRPPPPPLRHPPTTTPALEPLLPTAHVKGEREKQRREEEEEG
uniref:Uncharacterized protein n=1 Tax=Oryza sativa subsp. japonica TaxID=39947 RepID=Q6ZLA0_ORYSJ|nr:hypothetical protein [Oryza sativa Japonica Group]